MHRAALTASLRRALLWYRAAPLAARGLAIAGWAALIWWSSSTPGRMAPASVLRAFAYNGAHFVIFGVLAGLVLLTLPPALRSRRAWAVAAALLYGVVDEVHQHLVAGRSADPRDVLTDVVGAAWCVCALHWIEHRDPASARACLWLLPAGLATAMLATV
jgi:VanZ family protein